MNKKFFAEDSPLVQSNLASSFPLSKEASDSFKTL